MIVTAEEIYSIYHKYTFYFSKNIYPKTVNNFDKAKQNNNWIYFEKCALLVNRNEGQINHNLLIYSLALFYKGVFHPKMLIHPKGLKIYKTHVENLNVSNNTEIIHKGLYNSIKFIVEFCVENNINTFNDYIYYNYELISPMLMHYKAGSITKHFMVCIPSILLILNQFPQDVVSEYIDDINSWYYNLRPILINDAKVKRIIDNIDRIVNEHIKLKIKQKENNT